MQMMSLIQLVKIIEFIIAASFGLLGYKGFEIPDQTSYTAILHSQLSLTKLI